MTFAGGQYGPDAQQDTLGDALIGAAVVVPEGYTATLDVYANLTITGPATDSLTYTITPVGRSAITRTCRVLPLVSETDTRLGEVEGAAGGITSAFFATVSGGDPDDIPSDGSTHTFSWEAFGRADNPYATSPTLDGCFLDPGDDTLIIVPVGRILTIVRNGAIITGTDTPTVNQAVFVERMVASYQTEFIPTAGFNWADFSYLFPGYHANIRETITLVPSDTDLRLTVRAPDVTGCYASAALSIFDHGPAA